MMKLYALSMSCVKHFPDRSEMHSRPGYCIAISQEEAVGMGIKLITQKYPHEQLCDHHSCVALEIPDDVLSLVKIKVADLCRQPMPETRAEMLFDAATGQEE